MIVEVAETYGALFDVLCSPNNAGKEDREDYVMKWSKKRYLFNLFAFRCTEKER